MTVNETSSADPELPAADDDTRRTIRLDNEASRRILELERRVADLTGALAAVDRENLHNRDRLMELRSSFSWRITRPLRLLRRAVLALLSRAPR